MHQQQLARLALKEDVVALFFGNILPMALNRRPTIEVEAGSLCQVLLIKPLHLPAVARR
jgi:hypothetical protein